MENNPDSSSDGNPESLQEILTSIPKELLSGQVLYDRISILNLSNSQLSHIPLIASTQSSIFKQLPSLRVLRLNNNSLTSIPPDIGLCTSLEFIYLQHNQLVQLPDEIGNLSNLQSLQLHQNNLISLPETLFQLKRLNKITLEDNKALPSTLVPIINSLLNRSSSLDLGRLIKYDQSSEIPESQQKKSTESERSSTSSYLYQIPPQITHLYQHLKKLDLNGNRLTRLIPEITTFSLLQSLILSHNHFASIPNEIFTLHNLKRLNLSYNRLQEIPADIIRLKRLKRLKLDHNKIHSVPVEIGKVNSFLLVFHHHENYQTILIWSSISNFVSISLDY